jgi:hypothetical protein
MPITPRSARPLSPQHPPRPASPLGEAHRLTAIPRDWAQEERTGTTRPEGGFAQHLEEAIQLNRSRRDVYDRLSGGRTRSLSNQLIALEQLTLPFAYVLDRWAARFHARGLPVLKEDFVSMQEVRSPFAPPRWRGVASAPETERIQGWLDGYRKTLGEALGRNDFIAIAQTSHDLLGRLEEAEKEQQVHWAMTKHLVESLGLAALNALDYAERSGGDTLRLSRTFIRFQALGLLGATSVDRKAQGFHRQGIGILVNDIPEIPFASRWKAHHEGLPEALRKRDQ